MQSGGNIEEIIQQLEKLTSQVKAMQGRNSGVDTTVLMAKNAALEVDLARANKRLEAWAAIGRSIAATNDGIDSLKTVPNKAAREILSLGFMFSLDKVMKDAAELYRAQQGQKPAKTAGASE